MKQYVIVRSGKIDEELDGEDYLSRTVYEPEELYDIGVLDPDGNKVMARRKMDPIGFVRWRDQ